MPETGKGLPLPERLWALSDATNAFLKEVPELPLLIDFDAESLAFAFKVPSNFAMSDPILESTFRPLMSMSLNGIMQVACQNRSGMALHGPLVQGVRLQSLAVLPDLFYSLTLQMFIFLHQCIRFGMRFKRHPDLFTTLENPPLTLVAQNIEIRQEGLKNPPLANIALILRSKLRTQILLALHHFFPILLSF
ncbi:MAG: hypothetical protein VW642_08860 [Halieaceae bacterium]